MPRLSARGLLVLASVLSFCLFLYFTALGISGGDSGDLVTAAAVFGVPHPPGYPLYTFLGFLVSRLPLFTVAWRVGILSALFHALTVFLVMATVRRLTASTVSAVLAGALLVGNYNFFQYSVTPEVFALFDFFVISVFYIMLLLTERFDARVFSFGAFVLGLSLSHHHAIAFLIPSVVYWGYCKRVDIFRNKRDIVIAFACFGAGLLPYLYIPVAAHTNAIINWDHAVTIDNFIRLVTRKDYGTFVSGGGFAPDLVSRLLAVKAYGQFLLIDFGAALVFAVSGLAFVLWKHRTSGVLLLLSLLFLGPVFFFYASFPFTGKFSIGTYERFLLPSYVLFAVCFGAGVGNIGLLVRPKNRRAVSMLASAVCIVILFVSGYHTLWRFWSFRADKTAEHFAEDILSGLPSRSIVLLAFDTPLFTAQYIRYANGVRPDVYLIHASRISSPDYQDILSFQFPDLHIPKYVDQPFTTAFVTANIEHPVFTNVPFPIGSGWFWVPYGLLYRATQEKDLPQVSDMYQENIRLWSSYHDPRSGILSRYPHLMLADVLDQYAAGRLALGKALLRAQKYQEAEREFQYATDLNPDTKAVDAYLLLGIARTYEKHCTKALDAFAKAKEVSPADDERIPLYESFTVRDCLGDGKKADELYSRYESAKQRQEIPLDRL